MVLGGNLGFLGLRTNFLVVLPKAGNGCKHYDCKKNFHVADPCVCKA